MFFKKRPKFISPKGLFLIIIACLNIDYLTVHAQSSQSVTEIITDYGGFWQSGNTSLTSTTTINTTRPNNSHNLLAFTYKDVRYSTGVNNGILIGHNLTYSAGYFLPSAFNFTMTPNSQTKVALGSSYDGIDQGASSPAPIRNFAHYLWDGKNGLNLGTGIANIPATSNLTYTTGSIVPGAIGDNKPDILISQIADPAGSADTYQFLNGSNVPIKNPLTIIFTQLPVLGRWFADFYEASTDPLTLGAGFIKGERDIRLWAADFSDFGLTTADAEAVKGFRIQFSGNSDLAFVSFNTSSFVNTLPVELINFISENVNEQVQLTWQTTSESNSAYFEVETSKDGVTFRPLERIPASVNSDAIKDYQYLHQTPVEGTNYYRLKQIDLNGTQRYSPVIAEQVKVNSSPFATVQVKPNPFQNQISLFIPGFKTSAKIEVEVSSVDGKQLYKSTLSNPTQPSWTQLNDLPNLKPGMYLLKVRTDYRQEVLKIMRE